MVDFDANQVLLEHREVDSQVAQVLGELACDFGSDRRCQPGVRASRLGSCGVVALPRGPSTVTFRALMVTLTGKREPSARLPSIQSRFLVRFQREAP